jgi:hypothetical protein
MPLVPRLRTPVPFAAVVDALDAGHQRLTGSSLTPESYAIAASQLQEEHGVGTVAGAQVLWAVWNYNLGNHDALRGERSDPSVSIFDTSPEHEVLAGHDATARHVRRAYLDAIDGAEGYWTCIRDDFSEAYQAIVDGDLVAFVAALKKRGYFTASEAVYLHAMVQIVSGWTHRIADDAAMEAETKSIPPPPPPA